MDHREGAVFRRPGTKAHPLGKPYVRKHDHGGGQIKTAWIGACHRAGFADRVPITDTTGKPVCDAKGRPRYRWCAHYSPHDCRHTWATWHYAENRNLRALMELSGWKSEAMVMRYSHVNTDHLRATIEALPSTKSAQSREATS